MSNIVLFGASSLGIEIMTKLFRTHNIICFIDNDKKKWNKEICSVKILPPSELNNIDYDLIVISSSYYKEIEEQLEKMNIYKFTRFYTSNDLISPNNKEYYVQKYGKDAVDNRKFLNLGAGTFKHSCWQNVDHYSLWYKTNVIDIDIDFLKDFKLPIEDDSIYVVYTSHMIEHIWDHNTQSLFNEVYRVLKKGGTFRVTCPNIDLHYRAYKNNDTGYFYWKDYDENTKNMSIQQLFIEQFASHVSQLVKDSPSRKFSDKEIDEIFKTMNYEEGLNKISSKCDINYQKKNPEWHVNWYNEKKLRKMLKKSGFEDVYLSAYGQSKEHILRDTNFFDNTHPKMSIYIEAVK